MQGELLITGPSLSPGYLNNDKLSAECSINNEGIRWYRTGDYVGVNDKLLLTYLGRLDRMVKKRGYRIELDEIQKTVEQCVEVKRAAVIARYDHTNSTKIIAFYEGQSAHVCDDIQSGIKPLDSILLYIKKQLPSYMWPDQWVNLSQLPLTRTDKIDYNALASYDSI
jgi:acyl-coenzyme A synthetase/AMP-(fatty) acid ligase